jgi:tetratricopeptide (TPR) repeat protein
MPPEETLEAATDEILRSHCGKPLTDIQRMILRESLVGKGYERMEGYATQHIKNEGTALWNLLSEALGEKVGKKNFKGALENWQKDREVAKTPPALSVYNPETWVGRSTIIDELLPVHYSLGQYELASDFDLQYLTIAREIDDRLGEGIALVNTGATQLKLEQYPKSLTNIQTALEIFREIGNKTNEAKALKTLAELHQALGKVEVARQPCQQALALATELGIPLAEKCRQLMAQLEPSREVQPP